MNYDYLVNKIAWPVLNEMQPLNTNDDSVEAIAAHRQKGIEESRAAAIGYKPTKIEYVAGLNGAPDVELRIFGALGGLQKPALFHIHGGGYLFSAAEGNDDRNWIIAQQNDCVVVSVNYRKSPEATFPLPLEDCYAGLSWMHNHADEISIDASKIVITGDSAGGGLAAATALMAHDIGDIKLAGQVLIYPMSDYRTGGPDEISPNPTTGHYVWKRNYNQFGWKGYRGDYDLADAENGYFSPTLRQNLSGIPPVYIATGALDLFLEENLDYATRVSKAGVPMELHVYPGAVHSFYNFGDCSIVRKFIADRNAALACFWGRET